MYNVSGKWSNYEKNILIVVYTLQEKRCFLVILDKVQIIFYQNRN